MKITRDNKIHLGSKVDHSKMKTDFLKEIEKSLTSRWS